MRVFLAIAVILAGLMTLALTARSADGFLKTIDDMPLAPGLAEVESSAIVFGSGADEIAQAGATGTAMIDAVMSFYTRTLPQLGWKPVAAAPIWRRTGPKAEAAWRRGTQKLQIDLHQQGKDLTAGFMLTPIDHKP